MTTYLQISERLRWWRRTATGRERMTSARPRNAASGAFLDGDEPTTVTFTDDDAVDIPALLAQGAIRPLPAKPAPKPKRTEVG